MEEKKSLPDRSGHHYSDMLLRQYPWMKETLTEGEYPLAVSHQKPKTVRGFTSIFIGLYVALDTLLHPAYFVNVLFYLLLILFGAALTYSGFWAIVFAKRTYVVVTSQRLIHRKADLFGRSGKTLCIPRSEINRVRFLKSTVMYRVLSSDGTVLLELISGKSLSIPNILDAESIFEALR